MEIYVIYHTKLISSSWKTNREISLVVNGLNLDKFWQNIILYIRGYELKKENTLEE